MEYIRQRRSSSLASQVSVSSALSDEDEGMDIFDGIEEDAPRRFAFDMPAYPKRHERRLPKYCIEVFDPTTMNHLSWDIFVLMILFVVLLVTPYEFAFVNTVDLELAVINWLIIVVFFFDMAVTFNTAITAINPRTQTLVWILDRKRIAKHYFRCWFWIDFVSLVPWAALPLPESFSLLRLARLLRLFRIARILKAPKLFEKLGNFFNVSYQTSLVFKYTTILLALLHIEACLIRLVFELVKRDRNNKDLTNSVLTAPEFIVWRPHFNQGNFAVYLHCVDWGMQTLLGESQYVNSTEAIFSLINNLIGIMFFSFLIGDLANILCNLDPAANDYKQTVDALNNFMHVQNFPDSVKSNLRTYLANSEPIFRSEFENSMIARLSPSLQELIAHMLLGRKVAKTPFFSYARQRTLGLNVGRILHIRPKDWRSYEDLGDSKTREAVLLLLRPGMQYDLRYEDNGRVEHNVHHSRINMNYESTEMQKAMQEMESISKLIVTQLAARMHMTLVLQGEQLMRKDLTLNDKMYIVEKGAIYSFGRDVTYPFKIEKFGQGACIGDREVAFHVAGHPPTPVWYNARATCLTRCLYLKADDLLEVLSAPGYHNFRRYMARYGVWAHFKMNFYLAIKTGKIVDPILLTWRNWNADKGCIESAESDKDSSSDDDMNDDSKNQQKLRNRIQFIEKQLMLITDKLGAERAPRHSKKVPQQQDHRVPSSTEKQTKYRPLSQPLPLRSSSDKSQPRRHTSAEPYMINGVREEALSHYERQQQHSSSRQSLKIRHSPRDFAQTRAMRVNRDEETDEIEDDDRGIVYPIYYETDTRDERNNRRRSSNSRGGTLPADDGEDGEGVYSPNTYHSVSRIVSSAKSNSTRAPPRAASHRGGSSLNNNSSVPNMYHPVYVPRTSSRSSSRAKPDAMLHV